MKKITFLCIAFVFCSFIWQLNAQSVTNQNFGANGPDSAPTVLTINSGDITVNQGQPITAVALTNFVSHYYSPTGGTTYCNNWYSFNLAVTGGNADGTSIADGCATDFEGLDVTGFTTITLTSVDSDGYTDTVYFNIDLAVTYDTPACPAPISLAANNITTTTADLSWTEDGTATTWDVELVDVTASGTQTGTPTATGVANPYMLSDLTPFNNYQFYVRADCGGSTSAWSGPFSFATMALPPDNTTCATASLLNCGDTINGTTEGSTGTSEGSGCSVGDNGVWFTFKGTGGDITVTSTSSFDHEMDITSGACGALTNIVCRDSSTGEESYTIPLTVLDADYYVYIAQYASGNTTTGTYSITLTCATPPACTQAVVASSTVTTDCAASEFSVDVDITSVGDAVEISNGTDTWPITGTGITTAGPFAFGASQTLTVVHSDTACDLELGSFNVAACPPANDDCANATALTAGSDLTCSSPVTGTTIGATQSLPGCIGTANDDVWYSFVATATQHSIIVNNTGGSSDIVTEVFDSCGGTSLGCQDTPNSPVNVTDLTIGNTYYFRIYTWSSSATTRSTFEVCVGTPPSPPVNDDCANALTLTESTDGTCNNAVAGTTVSAAPSAAGTCSTTGKDVWYTFTPSTTGDYVFKVTETQDFGFSSTYVSVYSGACGATTQVGTSCSNSSVTLSLTAATPYYVVVRSTSAATGVNFDLCTYPAPPPPANDDCSGAIALTPGVNYAANPVDGTVEGATLGTETSTCTTFGPGPGVWYSIVVPSDGNITIETGPDTATGNTEFDSQIEAFSGTCGSLTSIDCDDDGAPTGGFSLLDLTGLTGGSTIYVRVWEYGGNETEPFSISAYNTTLSVGDVSSPNAFTYFPNPVKNTLNLKAQSNIQNVSIYNMLGQEVVRQAPNTFNSEVDMSALQTGAYFVKVTINDATETIRVIKQ